MLPTLLLLLLRYLLLPLLLLLLLMLLTVLLLLPLLLGPTLLVLVVLLVPPFLPLMVMLLRASRRSRSSPARPCLVPLPLVRLQLAQPLYRVLVHCIHRLRSISGCLGGRLQCMQQWGR